jgi:hypothetical protein
MPCGRCGQGDNDATIVETDDLSIDELMDDCFASKPPLGEDPKSEFPVVITVLRRSADAFVATHKPTTQIS